MKTNNVFLNRFFSLLVVGLFFFTGQVFASGVSTPTLTLKAHGGVVQFDGGSTSKFKVPITIPANTNSYTIEGWYDLGQTNPYKNLFIQSGIKLGLGSSNNLEFVDFNTSEYLITSSNSIDANGWHHIATVNDEGNISIYVDGNSVGNKSITSTSLPSADFKIMANLKGSVDEFRVWSTARTGADINATMNKQLDGNETGLVAYYNFDERVGDKVVDITGNGNDGTIEGNVTRLNFLGDGLNFDGNDYIETSAPVTTKIDNFSISSWFKWDGTSFTGGRALIENGTADPYWYGLHLWDDDGIKRPAIWIGGTGEIYSSNAVVKANQWNHIVIQRDNGTWKMFFNSKEVTLDTGHSVTTAPNVPSGVTAIGSFNNSDDIGHYGSIAEVSIWEKALTQTEIKHLMASAPNTTDTTLVGYWPLNEGSGTTVKDDSTNGNDGNITGATWIDTAPTIYGNNIYTSTGTQTLYKLTVENNTTLPIYGYNGNIPSTLLDFNSTSGSFIYYNTTAGSDTLDINATSENLNSLFNVTVYANSNAPTFQAIADINLSNSGSDFNITLNATDIEGDPINYTASSSDTAIATVSIVNSTLVVTPISSANGSITIEVNATASGQTVTQSFTINLTTPADTTPPTINTIYDRYRLKNATSFKIPLSISDDSTSDLNLSVSSDTTSNVASFSLSGGGTNSTNGTTYTTTYSGPLKDFNLTVTPTSNMVGSKRFEIKVTDASGKWTKRFFNVLIDNQQYDDIPTKETQATYDAVANLDISVPNKNRYSLNSWTDFQNSIITKRVEYDKFTIDTNRIVADDLIKDTNGTVTYNSVTPDVQNTLEFNATIDNVATSTLFANHHIPFTFSDTNAFSQKVFVKYTQEKLKLKDDYFQSDTTYSSLSSFITELQKNEMSYGFIRNIDRSKILTLGSGTNSGNLIERDENGTITNEYAGTWSTHTINGYETLIIHPNSSDYKQDSAFVRVGNKIKYAEYHAVGDIYSYLLLNKAAKDELYHTLSPNPKISIPLNNGYTYISLHNSKTLCDADVQDSYSYCDQNNTLDSIFGDNPAINLVFKYGNSWLYWDRTQNANPAYSIQKFSTLNPLEGILVQTLSATSVLIPFDEDSVLTNDFSNLFTKGWTLMSNQKEQTVAQIKAALANQGKELIYLLLLRDNRWYLYNNNIWKKYNADGTSIEQTLTSNPIHRYESFWVYFQ